jgi:hypothetical protein
LPLYYKNSTYQDLSINNPLTNILTKRIKATYHVVVNCTNDHVSTLQTHNILKLPSDYSIGFTDSELISLFMKKLKKSWNTDNRGKFHYAWCKEVEKGKGAHWHFMSLVDSNKSQNYYINNLVADCWERTLQPQNYKKGLVHRAGHRTFRNNDIQQIDDALYWASYLCKLRKGSSNGKGFFNTSQTNRELKLVA